MSNFITEPVARIAAKWWGSKIKGHGSVHDNGDISFGSIYAGLLADMCSTPADEDHVNRFVDLLTNAIMTENSTGHDVILDCDYSPDAILGDCARTAEISEHNFPWKTSMRISANRISVKEGYGQPYAVIWTSETEEATE